MGQMKRDKHIVEYTCFKGGLHMEENQEQKVALSPPWYTLRNQLLYTIGKTPGVIVGELEEGTDTNYLIRIVVTNCMKQAKAVRFVVLPVYKIGDVTVVTQVYQEGTLVPMPTCDITEVEQVIEILTYAFWCNPLYKGTLNVEGKLNPMQQGLLGSAVGIVRPYVIQFYNDDIGNVCNNYVEVASKVFQEVLNLTYGSIPIRISFNTYDKKCLQKAPIIPACGC